MSYSAQAQLSKDTDFISRVASCGAVEVDVADRGLPMDWAAANVWDVAAAPGFADAYESALVAEVERPGNDPAVITDAQILSAVQALLAEE